MREGPVGVLLGRACLLLIRAQPGKQVDAPCKIDVVLLGIAQQVGQVVQHGIAAVIVIVFLDLCKELLQTGKFFAQHFVLQHIPGIGVVGHGIE